MNKNTWQKQKTIAKRQSRDRERVLAELRKMPIISVACERAGIGRTTFHRWMKEDEAFEVVVDEAMHEGDELMNDMGKSQLLALIKDKRMEAVKYYLEKHHPEFLSEKARAARDSKSDIKIILLHDDEA